MLATIFQVDGAEGDHRLKGEEKWGGGLDVAAGVLMRNLIVILVVAGLMEIGMMGFAVRNAILLVSVVVMALHARCEARPDEGCQEYAPEFLHGNKMECRWLASKPDFLRAEGGFFPTANGCESACFLERW